MKIGDLVVAKRVWGREIFTIERIDSGRAYLKGRNIRLVTEVTIDELEPVEDCVQPVKIPDLRSNRSESIKVGTVLHIDGDDYYLKKALRVYKNYEINAVGYHIAEDKIADYVLELLKRHNPDILVLTGHDGIKIGRENMLSEIESYRFSKCYSDAVKIARNYRKDLDDLVIVSGACQSFYELLIDSGSNFASSPDRSNIHLLDPVIIASEIALFPATSYMPIETIIDNTVTKKLGGLDTRGKARKIYRGG